MTTPMYHKVADMLDAVEAFPTATDEERAVAARVVSRQVHAKELAEILGLDGRGSE